MKLTLPETAEALGLSDDSYEAVHAEALRLRDENNRLRAELVIVRQSDRAMGRLVREARAEAERLRSSLTQESP